MDNILDTRDLNKRLDELEEQLNDLDTNIMDISDELEEMEEELESFKLNNLEDKFIKESIGIKTLELEKAKEELEEFKQSNEFEELEELKELESEIPQWIDGNQLINEDHFIDYCKDLIKDIGDLPKNIPSYIVIDWESTAENLKVDYSEIDYQGETWFYRNY